MKSMSKEIGIDLGTSYTRISVRGRGTVLSEPTVVAINKVTGEILAVGNQAKEMLGRTPDNIIAVRPLKDGIIVRYNKEDYMVHLNDDNNSYTLERTHVIDHNVYVNGGK